MAEYVDLVLCKYSEDANSFRLFRAPAWSCLDSGDRVVVDTKLGKRLAIVIHTMTVEKDSDAYKLVMKLVPTDVPLRKVLSRVVYKDIVYKEEEDGTEFSDKVQTEDVE